MSTTPIPATTDLDPASPPSPGLGLEHVAVTTPDVERLLRFYVGVVGLDLRSLTAPVGTPYTRVAAFGGRGSPLLVAYEVPGFRPSERARRGLPAVDHVALRCIDAATLDQLERRLRATGHLAGDAADRDGCRTVPFTDPDGTEVLAVWGPTPLSPPTHRPPEEHP